MLLSNKAKKLRTTLSDFPEERILTVAAFAREYFKAVSSHPDSKYAYFLGAGCSITSGIPAAGALAEKWIDEEWKFESQHTDLSEQAWKDEQFPPQEIKNESTGDTWKSYSHHYAAALQKRHKLPVHQQQAIEEITTGINCQTGEVFQDIFPGFGYANLA